MYSWSLVTEIDIHTHTDTESQQHQDEHLPANISNCLHFAVPSASKPLALPTFRLAQAMFRTRNAVAFFGQVTATSILSTPPLILFSIDSGKRCGIGGDRNGIASSLLKPRNVRQITIFGGTVVRLQMPSPRSRSLTSNENIPGLFSLYSAIWCSNSGVTTRGFDPPITPGRIEPVSWYRFRIFDTQPWLTRRCREITHGRMPLPAMLTMLRRTLLGSGRPLMKMPPNWLRRPCPWIISSAIFELWREREHLD